MDYNSVIRDLNGLSINEYMLKISEDFKISKYEEDGSYMPSCRQTCGMYKDGEWYILAVKEGTYNPYDLADRLDASILQKGLLSKALGINDSRTDKGIVFVGGIRGLYELERRVEQGMRIAFSLYPVSISELMDIEDAGKAKPPKSTWFEQNLEAGRLFINWDD